MSSQPELHPVVLATSIEGASPWPWPVAACKPNSAIRLSGDSTEAEVGSVIAQLIIYNRIEAESIVPDLLLAAIVSESLLLPGGVQASIDQLVIDPSCCCGLEGWREWLDFLRTGESPWMGHDPDPWVEWAGASVRIWPDAVSTSGPANPPIEFERSRFVAELGRVERDLQAFLSRVERWARPLMISDPIGLRRKMDECFRISG